jgi:hypothetical protein
MDDVRMVVPLARAEREAWFQAAQIDLRSLRDQARFLIQQGLFERGFLEADKVSAGASREVDDGQRK